MKLIVISLLLILTLSADDKESTEKDDTSEKDSKFGDCISKEKCIKPDCKDKDSEKNCKSDLEKVTKSKNPTTQEEFDKSDMKSWEEFLKKEDKLSKSVKTYVSCLDKC